MKKYMHGGLLILSTLIFATHAMENPLVPVSPSSSVESPARKLVGLKDVNLHRVRRQLFKEKKAKRQCPICKKEVFNLTVHTRVHTGERPFVCTYEGCDYRTIDSSTLKQHQRTHTQEKPYSCPTCGQRFALAGNLTMHIRARHHKERPEKCPYCEYTAILKSYIQRHVASKHKDVHN